MSFSDFILLWFLVGLIISYVGMKVTGAPVEDGDDLCHVLGLSWLGPTLIFILIFMLVDERILHPLKMRKLDKAHEAERRERQEKMFRAAQPSAARRNFEF